MERLTKVIGSDGTLYDISNKLAGLEADKAVKIRMILEKLAAYEDAEEQGLLLRLPCGIGVDVYIIPSKVNYELNILNEHSENNKVYHQKVASVTYTEKEWYIECDKDHEYGTGRILSEETYKITWFLSQEEAEAKLKAVDAQLKKLKSNQTLKTEYSSGIKENVSMSNFDRIKRCENEYQMTDLLAGYICNNVHKLRNRDGTFNSLEILQWLQSNKDIFGEEKIH